MKKTVLVLLLFVLALTGCGQDGGDINVTIHYSNIDEIHAVAGQPALGYAEWNPDTGRCDIYVPKPENANDHARLYVLGHEMFHCDQGEFHGPDWKPMQVFGVDLIKLSKEEHEKVDILNQVEVK